MMQLRPYQREALGAIYRHLRERDDNPAVVIPTGGGKTPVMATICRDAVERWNGRVIVLAHVRELLEQAVDKLRRVAPELMLKVGIYSAGLKSRDTQHPIIVAGIQSVYKRACELDAFDLAIIDEAHMIPPEGDGMYRTFLDDARTVNPNLRVIGLTATPFRMKSGSICAPDNILNHICYEIGVRELIVQGFLCPLETKAGRAKADTSGLHVRAGEFVASETEALMDTDQLVDAACREIVDRTRDRKAVLVFTSGVNHGEHVAATLRRLSHDRVETVFGQTLSFDRKQTLADFKAGRLKYLVNVNVLTHGFDAPNVDCVAMLRPTMSPGLYYQMVGRGFRTCEGKTDCLVLDFGGNVMRHGPVDAIRIRETKKGNGPPPAKECPQCNAVIAAGYAVCPQCGHEFPPPERTQHDAKASNAGILSGEVTVEEHEVFNVFYRVHVKRGSKGDAPLTMRVEYMLGLEEAVSEWICFEHTGWPRQKAEAWWRRRSNAPVPDTAEEAVRRAKGGSIAETTHITVRSVAGERFPRIIGYELGEKPLYREPGWDDVGQAADAEPVEEEPAESWFEEEEVPF